MTTIDKNDLKIDAIALTKKTLERDRVKRFYKDVSVARLDDGYCVQLDGRQIKTPGKRHNAVPEQALAEMMRAEWEDQKDYIDADTMPVTRLVNTAIDSIAIDRPAVVADVVGYANSDLLCYRASEPDELVEMQNKYWDNILDWAALELGARLETICGIIHLEQPKSSLDRIRQEIEILDLIQLSVVASMTNLLGSVVLALAVFRGKLDAESAWTAAFVDENFQASKWGSDEEADARRARRWIEMDAASRVAAACN